VKKFVGHLVLFLGSGMSAGAGLPVWSSLLVTLAEKAGKKFLNK
jgi:hypothetical protein